MESTGRAAGANDPAGALADAARRHAPGVRRVVVGYSGGPDSTLLLALALEQWPKRRVRAVHVDHGWHADAADWARTCRRRARALGTRCDVLEVDSRPRAGEGPEAAARAARYDALARRLEPGDALLTAHHRDDQAETLLLALLRGGGVHGWAGMSHRRRLGPGVHLRPWLEVSREAIRTELARRELEWSDDPANTNPRYDRAWVRHHVLPVLRGRWPEVDGTLARAARQAGEAAAGVDALAARDYVSCRGQDGSTLWIAALKTLPEPRQRALLRWWVDREGLQRPPAARLETFVRQLAEAAGNRTPRIAWPGGEIWAWRRQTWAIPPRTEVRPGAAYPWRDRSRPLALPHRELDPAQLEALGIYGESHGTLEIRFPQGGERLRPRRGARVQVLRELLRRAGVPPWERDRIPLVYIDGELVGVIGIGGPEAR